MFTKSKFAIIALIVASLAGTSVSSSALASNENQSNFKRFQKSVSISNNSGGRIINYAMKAAEFRQSGTLVRFKGRCDSACTLYLGLPAQQTCVSPGAYFRFHSPSARSQKSARMAQVYLMRKYPGWVRSWIAQSNGLSRTLITMNYSYASKFLKPCASVASR
jgi:hypothetical protein